ncbi:LamG domain-containing protein [Candidatus Pacearchaeota archaeon]|jgi:hypothetical protein|nr:LamG domain-containing protein [Candidatus Pacearchaeota archaeon]
MSYLSAILSEANNGGLPVGYWPLAETNGVAAVDAMTQARGSGNDGTLLPNSGGAWTGGTLDNRPGPIAREGGGPAFNGSSGYIDCGVPSWSNFSGGDWCIEMWIKPVSVSASYFYAARDIAGGRCFTLAQNNWSAGAFDIVMFKTSGYCGYYASMDGKLIAGKWNHFVCQRHGSVFEFHVNGALLSSGVNIGTIGNMASSATSNLTFGRRLHTDGAGYFNGGIARVACYDRALAADRIAAHYLQGLNGTYDLMGLEL